MCPHFELVFYLTMEAFGRLHPSHRNFGQWDQMSEAERQLHRRDIADLYVAVARRYDHSAIFFHGPGGWRDGAGETLRTLEHIRRLSRHGLLHHDPRGRDVFDPQRRADDGLCG